MTKKAQFIKNVDLSHKLAMYIASHPNAVKNHPDPASYVVFSAEDRELNKRNEKILEGLKEEGTPVIKAEKTKSRKEPWKFVMF